MIIQNRIYKSELIDWQNVKDLQPDNLKLPYNYEHIKNSIKKHGIAKAYDVCEIDNELYWLDGHTRTQIFYDLINNGIDIPNKLMANFCKVEDKSEAIKILLEVHNQRQNPIAEEVLVEWLEIENVEVEYESLNVKSEDINYNENLETNYSDKNKEYDLDNFENLKYTFKLEYTEDDYNFVKDKLNKIGQSPEKILYNALKNG